VPWLLQHVWLVIESTPPGFVRCGHQIAISCSAYSLFLGLLGLAALEGLSVPLVLQTARGDKALDLGRLGVGRLAGLRLHLTTDYVLPDLW
jgi:hypothetical protein